LPEDEKIKLVAFKLRKYVFLWWENLTKKVKERQVED